MMRQQNRELKNGLNSMLDIDESSQLIRDKLKIEKNIIESEIYISREMRNIPI